MALNGAVSHGSSHSLGVLIQALPVHDRPCVREVSNNLNGDQHFLLDVDGADHLMQVASRVRQELPHLQVALQLMKLLHLVEGREVGETEIPTGRCM